MNHQWFDTLARTVAGSGSRRGLLRGLAGTVGLLVTGRRASHVAAQSGYLGPGDGCWDDSQCANLQSSPLFCADNGFDYDGPLNCCTYEFGDCDSDEGCCGAAGCIDGSCTSTPSTGDLESFVTCSGLGCTCVSGAQLACDGGLVCCPQGDSGLLGVCLPGNACNVSMTACTGQGCDCAVRDPYACDDDLVCCGPGEAGAIGTCQQRVDC